MMFTVGPSYAAALFRNHEIKILTPRRQGAKIIFHHEGPEGHEEIIVYPRNCGHIYNVFGSRGNKDRRI